MSVMADMIGNREALDGIYLEATLSSPDIHTCLQRRAKAGRGRAHTETFRTIVGPG